MRPENTPSPDSTPQIDSEILLSYIDTIPGNVVILDRDGKIAASNESWEDFVNKHGFQEQASMPGTDYLGMIQRNDMFSEPVTDGLRDIIQEKKDKFEIVSPGHSPNENCRIEVCASQFCVNGERYINITHNDVSERENSKSNFEQNDRLLQEIQREGKLGIWELDGDGTITWTDQLKRIHEVDPDSEVSFDEAFEFIHPDDRKHVRETIEQALDQNESYETLARILTGKNNKRWVKVSGHPAEASNENSKFRGFVQDITQQKRRERKLEKQTERHELAQEIADFGHWAVSLPERKNTWSDETYRIAGLNPADADVSTVEEVLTYYHPEDREKCKRLLLESIENNTQINFQARIKRPDGEVRNVEVYGTPRTDSEGNFVELFGVVKDITESVRTKRELRKTKQRFQQITETIDDVFWLNDMDGNILYISPSFEDTWGLPVEEIYDDREKFYELIHPEDEERVRRETQKENRSSNYDEEYRIVRPDGEVRWIHDRAFSVDDENVEGNRIAGIAKDITERKERQEELELKSRAIDEAPIGISIADASWSDNPLLFVNEAFSELTGYKREDALGRNCRYLQGDETDQSTVADLREAINANEPITREILNYTKEDEPFWNELTVSPVKNDEGEVTHYLGFQRDITERKDTQLELEEKQERFKQLSANSSEVFWMYNEDFTEMLFISDRQYQDILGRDPDRLREQPRDFLNGIHPDDHDKVMKTIDSITKGVKQKIDLRVNPGEDFDRWAEIEGVPVYDDDGNITRLTGTITDITQRKKREEELELKNTVIEQAPISITLADANADDNPFVYANEGFTELTGYDKDEVIGRNCRFLQGDETESQPVSNLRESIDAGKPVTEELLNYTKQGEPFWNKLTVAPVRDNNGEISHYMGFQQDITRRKSRERQLQRFRRAIEAAGHAVFMTDTTGQIEYVNSAFESITGYSEAEIIGENPRILGSDDTPDDFYDDLWSTIENGERWESDIKNERKNGDPYFAHETIAPIEDDQGETISYVAIQTDITEQKSTQKKLERSQRRFQQLAENTSEIFWMFNEDFSELLFVNDRQYRHIWGRNPHKLQDHPVDFLEGVHPGDKQIVTDAMDGLINGEPQTLEVRVNPGEEFERWVLIEGVPVFDDDGEVTRITGTVTDITEQKTTQEALEESKERFRQMSENIDAVYYNYAPDFSELYYVNPAYEDIWERSLDELYEDLWNFTEVIHEDDLDRVINKKKELIEDDLEGDTLIEYRIVTDSGELKWIEDEMFGVREEGKLKRIVGYAREITQRKKAKQKLKKKQRQFDQITENINQVFWITNIDKSKIHYISPSYEDVWGRSCQSLYENPKEFVDAIHPDDQQRVRDSLPSQVDGDYEIEYRIKKPDGEIRWIRDRAFPVENDEGEVFRIAGIANDITEKKQLAQEREKFVELVEHSRSYIGRADLDGNLTYLNQAGLDLIGIDTVDGAIGTPVENFHPDNKKEKFESIISTVKQSGQWNGKHKLVNQETGEKIDVLFDVFLIKDPETGEPLELAAVATDISKQVEIEKKLRESISEKKTLLQEVHHRVKNNLQVVLGILGLQSRRLEHDEAKSTLKASKQRIQSMAMIHQKLYEGADLDNLNFTEYVNDLVQKILDSYLEDQNGPELNINFQDYDLSPDSVICCGLIINETVTNAIEHGFSDPSEGTLTLEFWKDEAHDYHLIIADDGTGTDSENLEQNSSLGMTLVRNLAKNQLHGDITFRNDDGLVVEITFPGSDRRYD